MGQCVRLLKGTIGPRGGFVAGLLLALCCGWHAPAHAQQPATADTSGRPPLVEAVRFAGNEFFSDAELRAQVRTAANREFLGLPGFTWWLWLYRLGDAIGGGVGGAFQEMGEAPAYLDRGLLADDAERLRLFYQREGFREAAVEVRTEPEGPGRVRVVFQVEPGPPFYARWVRYEGLGPLGLDQRQRLLEASLLLSPGEETTIHILEDTGTVALGFRAPPEQRYSESVLLEERQRLLRFLRNEGYAAVARDSIRAFVYPQSADSFDVSFRIRPGARYRIGDVHFEVAGPEEVPARTDTLMRQPDGSTVTARIEDESQLSTRLLERALQMQPGAWYDQSEVLATKRQLEGTGVFSFTDIVPLTPDTLYRDSTRVLRLPHRISLRTRNRHQARLETFMLQRSGVLSSEAELGAGVGAAYENANLLGGGEAFRVRTSGSVAADLSSVQAEGATSLTNPYLVWPFSGLEERLDLYDASTQFSFNLLTARREDLQLIIRGRGATRLRLEMQHTATASSLVDLFDVSLSNPDTLSGFGATLDTLLLPVQDPVQRAQLLEDYTRPQVNSALRYTFRLADVNPLRRERGYSYEASVEVGNTLPYLLDRFAFTPDAVESSLPGLPFFGGGRARNRLLYRPYLRLVGDLRRYRPLSRDRVFAWKFIAGIAHPTGRPEVVPFDRRFYSGGASSVRGWGLRELRPFRADTLVVSDGVPNVLGGDIKLEASVELRKTVLENALSADWGLVLFADAGNVWFGPRNPSGSEGRFRFDSFYKQVGMGTGLGLRASWSYLILRLDLAYKAYDPLQPEASPFPDGLGRPRLHFGIGHAF